MIIDGTELLSGSCNLSMNAEHATFKTRSHQRSQFRSLVSSFEVTSDRCGRPDARPTCSVGFVPDLDRVDHPARVSVDAHLVEVDQLRVLIRANCSLAGSTEFRSNPTAQDLSALSVWNVACTGWSACSPTGQPRTS
jgi:hypothetical protein